MTRNKEKLVFVQDTPPTPFALTRLTSKGYRRTVYWRKTLHVLTSTIINTEHRFLLKNARWADAILTTPHPTSIVIKETASSRLIRNKLVLDPIILMVSCCVVRATEPCVRQRAWRECEIEICNADSEKSGVSIPFLVYLCTMGRATLSFVRWKRMDKICHGRLLRLLSGFTVSTFASFLLFFLYEDGPSLWVGLPGVSHNRM